MKTFLTYLCIGFTSTVLIGSTLRAFWRTPITPDYVEGYYAGFGDAVAMVGKAMDYMDAKERSQGVKWPVDEYRMVLRSALDNLGDPRGKEKINQLLEE